MSNDLIAIDIEVDCKDVTKALEKLKASLKSKTLMVGNRGKRHKVVLEERTHISFGIGLI